MKKISLAALLCSTCITGMAMADTTPIRVYAGANVATNSIMWNDSTLYHSSLADSNLGIGAQLGVKYAPDQIYNFGLTLNYDYMFDASADLSDAEKIFLSEINTGFADVGLTFDNYIRFANGNHKRSDFVFGIGLARVTERVEIKPVLGQTVSGSDHGGAFVLKFGYNQELTDNIDFLVDLRILATDGDLDGIVNLSAGIRYNF